MSKLKVCFLSTHFTFFYLPVASHITWYAVSDEPNFHNAGDSLDIASVKVVLSFPYAILDDSRLVPFKARSWPSSFMSSISLFRSFLHRVVSLFFTVFSVGSIWHTNSRLFI